MFELVIINRLKDAFNYQVRSKKNTRLKFKVKTGNSSKYFLFPTIAQKRFKSIQSAMSPIFRLTYMGATLTQSSLRLDNIYNQSAPDGEQNISDRVGDGITDDRHRTFGVIPDRV